MINLTITSARDKLRTASRHRGTAHVLTNGKTELNGDNAGESKANPRLQFGPMKHTEPPQRLMRVLLRNDKTGSYLRSQDHWTKNPRKARDFHNGWWATLCAFTMDPRNLVIEYDFDDERYNLDIPVVPGAA